MTIVRMCRAKLRQLSVHLGRRNRTLLNVDQSIRFSPEKPDHTVLNVDNNPITIPVVERCGDKWAHWRVFQFADATPGFFDLPPSERELIVIFSVLVHTSATAPKLG